MLLKTGAYRLCHITTFESEYQKSIDEVRKFL